MVIVNTSEMNHVTIDSDRKVVANLDFCSSLVNCTTTTFNKLSSGLNMSEVEVGIGQLALTAHCQFTYTTVSRTKLAALPLIAPQYRIVSLVFVATQ